MRRVLVALVGSVVIAVTAATIAATADARARSVFVVPCTDTIGNLSNPAGSDRHVALGLFSVPSVTVGSERLFGVLHWRYWTKVAVGVRRYRAPVTVSVPKAWRSKVAVTWGNRAGIMSSIRFSSCADATSPNWSAYAGGFYLRQHIVCVPLIVSDGQRTATVRVAIDGKCS